MGTGYVTFLKELGREEGLEQGLKQGLELGFTRTLVSLVRTGQLTREQARAMLRQQAGDGVIPLGRLADAEARLDAL